MAYLRRVSIFSFLLLIGYFIWMDILLFFFIQRREISWLEGQVPPTAPHQTQLYSPFNEFSVKLAMLDQLDNYIYSPLAELFEKYCDISHRYPLVTPNAISALGVVFAAFAAFLVFKGKKYHRMAVTVFQVNVLMKYSPVHPPVNPVVVFSPASASNILRRPGRTGC